MYIRSPLTVSGFSKVAQVKGLLLHRDLIEKATRTTEHNNKGHVGHLKVNADKKINHMIIMSYLANGM